MKERKWVSIPGFPIYEASADGNVRSIERVCRTSLKCQPTVTRKARVLKKTVCRNGYAYVSLYRDGKLFAEKVCTVIALTFLGDRPTGYQICHNNGVSTDDRSINLRYGTPKENQGDRARHGTKSIGEKNKTSKLTNSQVKAIFELKRKESSYVLGARFGVSPSTIQGIWNGKSWSHLTGMFFGKDFDAWLDKQKEDRIEEQ